MMNQIQKITMTSGTPRKNSTYIVAGTRMKRAADSRASPTKMPSTNPSRIAGIASRSVPPMNGPMPMSPCRIRNLKLLVMTEKSIASATSGGGADARDQTGDRVTALDARHDRRDREAEDEIDHGAGGQRFDGFRGVRLDLARLERELGDADRERHRRVLEEIQRLVGGGRHDQAQRDGKNDEPVGLKGREPHGHRRFELCPRNGLDAGADHFRDARAVVDAEREHAGPELGAVVEEPILHGARQQRRHAEVPEKHPHQQRDVAEELDVRRRGPAQRREAHRAQRAGHDAERHCEQPRQRRQLERGEQTLEQPAPRLAGPEHAPLERVRHMNMGAPKWPPNPPTFGRPGEAVVPLWVASRWAPKWPPNPPTFGPPRRSPGAPLDRVPMRPEHPPHPPPPPPPPPRPRPPPV